MKVELTKQRKWIIAGALLLGTATPSFALFGIGDIVFDPTSYASLVSQLTTLTQQYSMLKNNLTSFSLKSVWQTELAKLKTMQVVNTYGETNGMTTALNQDSTTAATTAWTSSKVALSSDTSTLLGSETVGNSAKLSQLAIIEASDSASPDCLNAVGSYRAARTASATANANLQTVQLDGTSATNSEVQQLNLLNAAQAQQLNEQQSQGALHACLAQQMTIQNMQQRNAAAQDLNTWATVQTQQTSNPTLNVSDTNTWTTYLP
jgi:hypothetical protein